MSFDSAGWHLYRPPGAAPGQRTAALVMAGPMTSVKEETLPHYAAVLAEAGCTVLTYDDVDLGRAGLACVCLGTGYGTEVTALDQRVKAAALIAGGCNITYTYLGLLGPDGMACYLGNLGTMRQGHYATREQRWIPAVAPPPGYGPSSILVWEAYEYCTTAHEREAPVPRRRHPLPHHPPRRPRPAHRAHRPRPALRAVRPHPRRPGG